MHREEKNKISREKILIASLEEFGNKDYSLVSVNDICKNHKISKGLLFHYYKNKDELFQLCVEKLFVELSSYIKENFKINNSNIEENLRAYVQIRFEFFHKYPYYKQIFYTSVINPPKHLIYEINILREPMIEINKYFWREIIKDLKLKSNINIEDAIEVITGLGNYLHLKIQYGELQSDYIESGMVEKYTKEYVDIVNMLLYGVVE